MLKLGTLELPRTAALAPMAGVADRAFREICIAQGACYVVGEMASAKGMNFHSPKTAELLEVTDNQRPMAVQLFGDDPASMAQAARTAAARRPDAIDINMGCPAPKIAGNGSGSALMKKPGLAGEIVRAVVGAVDLPVTVKMRKGWDDDNANAVQIACLAQEAGASAVIVHGRTRMQMYAPPVDLDVIAAVKRAVSIPVIGNGDCDSPQAVLEMYERTGCDLVMIGRGALGSPWLFRQVRGRLERGEVIPDPPVEERLALMLEQIRLACAYKGERVAMREARKHVAWYLKGWRGAAVLRREAGQLQRYEDLQELAGRALDACARGN